MTVVEKAAYLKGLYEGLGFDAESKEGKLWNALNDLLSDMAHEIEDLQSTGTDLADAMDEITEELGYLEEITCDLDSADDFDLADDEDELPFCSGNCESCGGDCPDFSVFNGGEDSDEDAEADIEYEYDIECPACGEEISIDEETLAQGFMLCPACGEKLEFELDEE